MADEARITEVGDAVIALIRNNAPVGPDDIEAVYAPSERLEDMAQRMIVRLFSASSAEVARLARGRVQKEYRVIIEAVEPYPRPADADPLGAVPRDWVRDRLRWVEQNVFDLLNDRVRQADRLLGTLWPQTCEYDPAGSQYDPAELDVNKVFRSRVIVAYRENVEG